jgi:SAM-dependent methyltransferase
VFRSTAHLYDLIYEAVGKDYATESEELRHIIEERNPGARTVLDVACGTGGHLRHLREHYEATGVDVLPEMLEVARASLQDVALIEADMRTLNLDRTFDAVLCLFSSIGYMRGTEELNAAVAAMARHLNPGGVLVVDGWVRPDRWREGITHVDVAEGDSIKVVRVTRSERDDTTTRLEMHHLVATAERIEHLIDLHEFTLFAPEQYEDAFRAARLSTEVMESPMRDRDRYVGVRPPKSSAATRERAPEHMPITGGRL